MMFAGMSEKMRNGFWFFGSDDAGIQSGPSVKRRFVEIVFRGASYGRILSDRWWRMCVIVGGVAGCELGCSAWVVIVMRMSMEAKKFCIFISFLRSSV